MSERPIIFSAPMVKAIMSGSKSQTRRILKPQPNALNGGKPLNDGRGSYSVDGGWKRLPYAVGDRLWAREAFITGFDIDDATGRPKGEQKVWYRADSPWPRWYDADSESTLDNPPWRSPIHMPRWASRITLEVTEARVQRLNEISEEDAKAEGIFKFYGIAVYGYDKRGTPGRHAMDTARDTFAAYWNTLHGPDAWAANPWVAAITFRRVE